MGGARINHGSVSGMCYVCDVLLVVEHGLAEERPSLVITLIILESFQSFVTIYDLRGIITSEECVWWLLHIVLCYAETDHCSINQFEFFKGP